MLAVHLTHVTSDTDIASRLVADLTRRGFQVRSNELGTVSRYAYRVKDETRVAICVFPHAAPTAVHYDQALAELRDLLEQNLLPIVLIRDTDGLPGWAMEGRLNLIRTTSSGYDTAFEALFRVLIGPLPPSADVVSRPSVLESPVGVAGWLQDLWVSDDSFGHIVRIDGPRTTVPVPGLDDPQQLHLDRTKLLVANKGADQILCADVKQGGAVTNIRSLIDSKTGALSRPNAVHQAAGHTAVTDTDNHRVLLTRDDAWRDPVRWDAIPVDSGLRFPCGVHIGSRYIWVADTYNHRLLAARRENPTALSRVELDDSIYPVAVIEDVRGRFVMISDEHGKRVLFYRLEADADGCPRLVPQISFGAAATPSGGKAVPIGTPGGMSVNRDNRLAVADRQLACVWLLQLDALADLSFGET